MIKLKISEEFYLPSKMITLKDMQSVIGFLIWLVIQSCQEKHLSGNLTILLLTLLEHFIALD